MATTPGGVLGVPEAEAAALEAGPGSPTSRPARPNLLRATGRCVLSFIYCPTTCGPKGHGSGSIAEVAAVGFYISVFPWPQTDRTGHSRNPVPLPPVPPSHWDVWAGEA